jgi:sugar lactone lactonase YvrE
MTMDDDGRLWIAMWGDRGAVHCYEPGSNRPLEVVSVPRAHHVSAVTFGGPDLNDLFVTTSQQDSGAGEWAGSVYRIRTPVRGRLPLPFRAPDGSGR